MIDIKVIVLLTLSTLTIASVCNGYKIGVGRADCTGPPVEVTFMGYAQLSQRGVGIHLRQFARTFIVDDGNQRVTYVVVDAGMMGHAVKRDVVALLEEKYGKMYSMQNVLISGTHTHSTPGGFLMHILYDMPTIGFVRETYRALVEGIYKSIVRAHNNMQEGRLYISETTIENANINRSPTSYLNNPEEERAQYQYDTDKKLVQIKFINKLEQKIGAINWFAVHPTSMNNTNRYISSDNVGYASLLLEHEINPNNLPGKGAFVGAFASTNLGDVSPNIMGPKCQFTGEACDLITSSCPEGHGQCVASGPGRDIEESTKIIAERIYTGASKILNEKGREITGPIKFIHQYFDVPKATATYYNPKLRSVEKVKGCLPALGYSFAAGTTDGPGAFDFTQGTVTDNPLWNMLRDFIAPPTDDDIECHQPKPILLATGRASFPTEWQPKIVATQIFQLGDVIIAAVPGEFTTMAGRRLRNGLRNAILQATDKEYEVIIGGLANIYSSYITTPEEYEMQRYEAASTIFGRHTLTLYIDQYQKLVQAMLKDEYLEDGPEPPYLDSSLISLTPGVIYDGHPAGRDFGSMVNRLETHYKVNNTVRAKFVAGNPRNNFMNDLTYFTVEKLVPDGNWIIVATDANWETKFKWERVSSILGTSDIEFSWKIPTDTEIGVYRICHFGHYRTLFGSINPYEGCSEQFQVEQIR